MYRYTPMPYEFHENPDALRTKMLETFIENAGDLQKTWAQLGIAQFTWYRYCRFLNLKETIADVRKGIELSSIARRFTEVFKANGGNLTKTREDLGIGAKRWNYVCEQLGLDALSLKRYARVHNSTEALYTDAVQDSA